MTDTPSLFDQAESARRGEEAQVQVAANAAPDWKTKAMYAVFRVARERDEFTSDDVWDWGELPRTRENRALGPILRAAAGRGWIVRTERTAKTRQVSRHGTDVRIWKSKLR